MKIGIIGLGDMGRKYAWAYAGSGKHKVIGCDLPDKLDALREEYHGAGVEVLDNGVQVSKKSDLVLYCVEARKIGEAVKEYGRYTKPGAIVGGATSVKAPELQAFDMYLPRTAQIVTMHSLHGPSVDPKGQTLVVIRHRSTDEDYKRARDVFSELESKIVELESGDVHDQITADTQAATHVGFESMGTAWKDERILPWDCSRYSTGIDNVKALMTLRLFAGKPHVYSGLAILNPFAQPQVMRYAQSTSELFRLMIRGDETALRSRIKRAGDFVFGNGNGGESVLEDWMMNLPLAENMATSSIERMNACKRRAEPNSHLSLLAMVDAWHEMEVNPYHNLICQTPPFQLRLGIAEYLFRHPELLESSIRTALTDTEVKGDDLAFQNAAWDWARIIGRRDEKAYEEKFEDTRHFFMEHLPAARKISDVLISRIGMSKEEFEMRGFAEAAREIGIHLPGNGAAPKS